ncbi:MAG: (2Fe-2S) ferredoxin domain-containing protein [Pseudomonadales bacterium]|nr:(2Fe-2S) ferredoxin domain-containing protein [Pseudomonadales bacterium]
MPKPQYHLFVCAQARPNGHPRGSCATSGAADVMQTFAAQITAKNLLGKVALTQTGCLGPCQVGANVLVYPEGVLYSQVSGTDVEKIVDEHLVNGNPVTEKFAPTEVW